MSHSHIILHGKMNLSEMTHQERMSHIDLNTPCMQPHPAPHYRKALIAFSGINPGRKWFACHMCENDSVSGIPCQNPRHMYWGTNIENLHDVNPKTGMTPAEKISVKLKGKPTWNKGKTLSDETKQKMRKKHKKHKKHKPRSDEARANASAARLGKKRGPYKK